MIVTDPVSGLRWQVEEGTDDWLGPSDHESGLIGTARAMCPPGGVFLDVGAHVGSYALRMASRASQVIALEPNPMTFDTIVGNVLMNGLDNVDVRCLAAWSESGKRIKLYDSKGLVSGGSTGAVPIGQAVEVAEAPTITVDDLLDGDLVDLVKIDCEGAEVHVLVGMRETCAKHRPKLMIEMHDAYVEDPETYARTVRALIAEYGYRDPGRGVPYGGGYHLLCVPEELGDGVGD